MMLNEDYKDMLHALSVEGCEFLLVGAYAMAVHGIPRATLDIDFWVNPTGRNAEMVKKAIARFGAPLVDLKKEDLLKDDTIFQIGVAPRRIDIITGVSGLTFPEAFANSIQVRIEGIPCHVLSKEDIIRNKRAAGRPKDLADIVALESLPGDAE